VIKKILIIFGVVCLISANNNYAEQPAFDEQEFFRKIKESCYTLNASGLDNFVALVTSLKIERFAEENWDNKEIFPLQLIWFQPDKIYISQQGVPSLEKDKQEEFNELIQGLKSQLKGVLLDLQRFYITGLFYSINENYKLRHNEEAVQITYETGKGFDETRAKYLLGLNGLLIEIEISYPEQKKKIYITPSFRTIKTKWLISGWDVQTVINEKIVSGFQLKMNSVKTSGQWIPFDILLKVQKADEPGSTYYDEIKFRNFLFNQAIELIK